MNPDALSAADNLLSILALFLVWYALVRPALVDLFRQRMFALRDKLFDDVLEHPEIEFSDPAYAISRSWMNAMIRLAERMDLPTLFLHIARIRSKSVQSNINEYFSRLDTDYTADQKKELGEYVARAVGLFLVYVCLRSILLSLVLLTALLLGLLVKKLDPRELMKDETLRVVDHEAMYGHA